MPNPTSRLTNVFKKAKKAPIKKQKQKRNDPRVWHCGETKREGGVERKRKHRI
jgi:hypothetical protein